jgi:hypothetical protein
MPRKRGPKPGQFDFMCDRTWRVIASLADASYSNASDTYLAKTLDCSPRSVRRYVKKLKDDGRLTRTTVAYMVVGGWRKKRLMKTRFQSSDFGLTRHEVLNWQRSGRTRVVAIAAPPEPVRPPRPSPETNPYFIPMATNTIEGFGDPYHYDMPVSEHPRPCDAQIVPKTMLNGLLERVKKMREEGVKTETNPEYTKLSCQYIKASLARRKAQGNDE